MLCVSRKVVCLGAEQNGLPVEYKKSLEAIQTNNYSGPSILDQIPTIMNRRLNSPDYGPFNLKHDYKWLPLYNKIETKI